MVVDENGSGRVGLPRIDEELKWFFNDRLIKSDYLGNPMTKDDLICLRSLTVLGTG